MKDEAMNRAEQYAREAVANAIQELAAHGSDVKQVAPWLDSLRTGRKEYMAGLAKYRFYQSIITWRSSSIGLHDPCFVDVDYEKVEAFVKDARENAAAQYEAYVAKLVSKIGPATEARLVGNHVWSHSLLFVTTASGEEQIWKTQMILNQSKLGKVFNQFPTRRVKA